VKIPTPRFLVPALLASLFALRAEADTPKMTATSVGRVANVFELDGGFGAKETCSCVFVVGQADDYCVTFGTQPALPAQITIDHAAKTVSAAVPGMAPRVARVAGDGAGCVLDPP
jgi:hypothetical protein